ncbi:hypothetical protein Tco_1574311 [Tanacetum coccineum]
MINSLSNRYKRPKEIPIEFGLDLSLPLPEQDPPLLNKKRKIIELELKTYIAGLHYNRKLLEGVEFMKNLVIEEPEHRRFFIDAFGEPTFQRMSNIHKVETETLLGYKVMASNVKTTANKRLTVLMRKMMYEGPDKDKILTKRVKLENLGYTDV